MKKIWLAGTGVFVLALSGCNQKAKTPQTPDTPETEVADMSVPKTEAEAKVAYKTAKAEFDAARENFIKKRDRLQQAKAHLASFTSCPSDQVLKDISSYDKDWPKPMKDQKSWFEANGKRDGVVTTASGLQYKVNTKSAMKIDPPKPTQTVRVNYHGLFLDGKTFDSSYDRGEDIKFPLNRVIKGWTEGVGLMRPCDAWTFYIPSNLAYGDSGKGPIPAKTPLIFHVQLLGIE